MSFKEAQYVMVIPKTQRLCIWSSGYAKGSKELNQNQKLSKKLINLKEVIYKIQIEKIILE